MKRISATILIIVLLSSICAAEKRPVTPEDLYRFRYPADPRVSPGGEMVAYTIYDPDLESNSTNSDIWIMPLKGGKPRQLTRSPEADHSPRWSPDGSSIAFISGRDGTANIYIISVEGGEARKLTESETDIYSPSWSDDGKYIICGSRVIPEGKENRENWTEEKLPECEARTIDHLLFRQWNRWLGDKRNHLFLVDAGTGSMRDLTPGDMDIPPVSLASGHDFDISPDGKEVCYIRNTDPIPAAGTDHDLFVIDTEILKEKQITENPALDSECHYSPCGRYIAYTAMEKPGYESDRRRLVVYDRNSSEKKVLTEGLDRSPGQIIWGPDGKRLFFTARDRGRRSLYRVTLEGKVTRLSDTGYNGSPDITPGGRTIIYTRSDNSAPTELFAIPAAGGKARRLTEINREVLAGLNLPPLEEFTFTGAEGTEVHGFIQKPPQFDPGREYPAVLTIHGGPQGMWADRFMSSWFTFQLVCSPGYVGIFINPRGSAGYGSEFREQVSRDYGGRCYRDLMAGLDYVLENYEFVDGERLAAIGGSFGGYSVNWIMGQTGRFDCLVSHAGLYNLTSFYGATEELWFPEWDMGKSPWEEPELYHKWSPHRFAGKFGTPALITHGQKDFRVPFAESLQLFTALRRQGIESRLVVFPDEGHVISSPQNNVRWWMEIHRWLERYLKEE